jgi:hypothetical protein
MEGSASAFNGSYLVKVEKVAQKQILIINPKSLSYCTNVRDLKEILSNNVCP